MTTIPQEHAAKSVDNRVQQGSVGAQHKSGPGGAGNTGPGLDTTQPWEPVMPYHQTTHDPHGIRLDGCPKCLTRNNVAHDAQHDLDGYVAAYQCIVCGHAWLTSWMAG